MTAGDAGFKVAEVQDLTEEQIRQIYNLHRTALPDDVMPAFGISVTGAYLNTLNSQDIGAVLTAESEGRVIGYIALRFKEFSMAGCVGFTGILTFLGRALRRPSLLLRLIAQLRLRVKNPELSAEIDFFVVDPGFRGQSVGTRLVDLAETAASERGCNSIFTKTSNERLFGFYVRTKEAQLIDAYLVRSERYFSVGWPIAR